MHGPPTIFNLPQPTFLTRDSGWVSLDTVVRRVVEALAGAVSPLVAWSTIVLARHELRQHAAVDVGRLAAAVCDALRGEHVVVTPPVVRAVLEAYALELHELDVIQVAEG